MTATLPTIAELQHHCNFFSTLPDRYLVGLQAAGEIRTYRLDQGEGLNLRVGETGDDALFLLMGRVEIRQDGEWLSEGSSADFKCRPIPLTGQSVEITAAVASLICRASREQLDFLTGWSVMLEQLPPENVKIRSRLAQLLHPAIFMNLPFSNVEKAFERMTTRPVTAGEEVVKQGELGDNFYIIESGRAEVWQRGAYDDEQKLVAELGPGNHFGEDALITKGTRNATVRMVDDGTLLVLSQEDFSELIAKPMVNQVEPKLAAALVEGGYRYLDVRYEEEWEDGHIPGSMLVPLPDLRKRLSELDRGGRYVTYCLSGKRSAVGAMILKQNGLEAVCMGGGLRDWPYETVTD